MQSIEIPASVITIGKAAFIGCTSLTSVTFEQGSRLKTIKKNAFLNTTVKELDLSGCANMTQQEFETIKANNPKYSYNNTCTITYFPPSQFLPASTISNFTIVYNEKNKSKEKSN